MREEHPHLSFFGIDCSIATLFAPQVVENGTCSAATGTLLPFADGTFDVVLSVMTARYVLDKLALAHEIHRVLKPGGWGYASLDQFLVRPKEALASSPEDSDVFWRLGDHSAGIQILKTERGCPRRGAFAFGIIEEFVPWEHPSFRYVVSYCDVPGIERPEPSPQGHYVEL